MRLSIAAVAAMFAATLASCKFSSSHINDHWSVLSVPDRAFRTMTGYDGTQETSYKDFAWNEKKHNEVTTLRHLFNYNPLNPNQPELARLHEARPLNSILPNPWNYLHLDFAVGSIIGTIEQRGPTEFWAGIVETFEFDGTISSADARTFYGEDGELPPFEMTERGR